jgi:hypothetical protein
MTTPMTAAEFALAYGLLPASGTPAPAAPNAVYTTGLNERWDTVAWKLYGDPTQINVLVMANPAVPIVCQIPQGTVIQGGILPPPAAPASTTPWG